MVNPVDTDCWPIREIRAAHGADWIEVYQAYALPIAGAAIRHQAFVPPFKLTRMTWIKPSFLWMMYRSGWAGKEGQEVILRIRIKRSGFDWALAQAVLTRFERSIYPSSALWEESKRNACVLVQWDPARDLRLAPLPHRAIQIGLRGEAIRRYAEEWILSIEDVTELVHRIRGEVQAGRLDAAAEVLPVEQPYPVQSEAAERLGMQSSEPA